MKDNNEDKSKHNVPFLTSFFRSQASSAFATSFDFLSYGALYYLIGIHYVYATAIGNIIGAIVSFFLGRHWAFKRQDGKLAPQAIKYIITSVSSAAINTGAIYLITENLKIDPTVSKIIVSLIVGFSFNFLMFRYFVYK